MFLSVSVVCRECRRLLAACKQPERPQVIVFDSGCDYFIALKCLFVQSPVLLPIGPTDRPSKTRCTQRLRTVSTLSTTPKKLDLSWNIVGIEDDASDDEVIVSNSRQKISEKLDALRSY